MSVILAPILEGKLQAWKDWAGKLSGPKVRGFQHSLQSDAPRCLAGGDPGGADGHRALGGPRGRRSHAETRCLG